MKYLATTVLLVCLGFILFRVFLPDSWRDLYTTHWLEIRLICAIGVGIFLLAAKLNENGHKGNRDLAVILCIASAIGLLATFLPKPDAHDNWQPAFSILLPFSIPAACALLTIFFWPEDEDKK